MHRSLLPAFAMLGCAVPVQSYPALAQDCSPGRIGKVTVDGATLDDIAPLAVLEGTLDDPDRANRIALVATELLQARGFPYARLDVTRQAGCGTELHVSVRTGPQFRIAQLAFETDDDFPADARVLAVEDALGAVNAVGGAYLEDRMKRALVELERRYHEAGWIDASIAAPHATYDEGRGEVTVSVAIHAGPRYRIGRVVASGAGPATRAAVVEALGLRGGDWYNAPRVRVGIGRARRTTDRRVELRFDIAADRRSVDLEAHVK